MAFLSFLNGGHTRKPQPTTRVEPAIEGSVSAYPPVDPGIQVRSVDDILAAHHDLIARLKLCYGADRETFEADLLVPIRNYAAVVNLLPATADNFFADVGGLFRLGLEVAFFALQGTDGHIVSGRATISTRRHLEPRWRHATFLAGLCSELHRTLSQVVVTDARGEAWPAYLAPLTQWLHGRRATRFFVRWLANAQESRSLGLFALPHIVPASTMQHLAAGNTVAVPQMLSCISGIPLYREQNILGDLVKRAAALVIDRDLIASANRYGKPILGAHLERYLLDAMRRLVASHPAWTPNQERSRVWHAKDGLFIVWPNAASEIRKLLEEDELPGIPKAPETIVEILLSAGVLEACPDSQSLWTIAPPPGKTVMEAVKLASPDILIPGHSQFATPLPTAIITRAAATPGASTAMSNRSDPDLVDAAQAASRDATASVDGQGAPADRPDKNQRAASQPAPHRSDAHVGSDVGRAPAAPVQDTLLPVFKLAAPMRLNPQVCEALSIAIDSLNGDAKAAAAITVAAGVFVPLEHFKRHRLDIPVVLRALGDTSMTVGSNGPRVSTVQHEIGGQTEIGFVLKSQFVCGLDPADFSPAA